MPPASIYNHSWAVTMPDATHNQNGTPAFGSLYLIWKCKYTTGLLCIILVIFQDRPMFSHINGKLSTRLFE